MAPSRNVAYSPKLGIQALLKSDKFRDFVTEEAGRVSNFKKELIEAAKIPRLAVALGAQP